MKKLWGLLKEHVKGDFSPGYYGSILLFLAVGMGLNGFIDFEERIDAHNGEAIRIVYYFTLYAVAYFGGIALMVVYRKQQALLRSGSFWCLSIAGLLILSVDAGFPFVFQILDHLNINLNIYTWAYSVAVNVVSLFIVCLPLAIVYWLFPVSRGNAYGLVTPGYDIKPYLLLLLMMVPVIGAASLTPAFSSFYPTYKPTPAAALLHWPAWAPPAAYELFYGLDFFNLELLFRGFMVIGLSGVLGKHAILPMVTTYCFLHFGKPVGEQIGSIAGGYILGVIAFYTRGIWGGVIIHIGIGWMMELAAALTD